MAAASQYPHENRDHVITTISTCPRWNGMEIDYFQDEPVWHFSKRIGVLCGMMKEDDKTNLLCLTSISPPYFGRINTFENRLKKMSDLLPFVPFGINEWIKLRIEIAFNDEHIAIGNSSPQNADREICAICLDSFEIIRSGGLDNPLLSTTLKCSHAFHQKCLIPATKSALHVGLLLMDALKMGDSMRIDSASNKLFKNCHL